MNLEQMAQPENVAAMADTLAFLSTGIGGLFVAFGLWFVKRQIENIEKLHDRIDELEREVLVLQVEGGQEQTVFTSRKSRRRK